MRILYIGPDYPGANGTSWRDAFVDLGHEVRTIDDERLAPAPASTAGRIAQKLRRRPPARVVGALNSLIEDEARRFSPRLIFFVKARHVAPDTLAAARRIAPCFLWVNDDMFNPAYLTPTFFSTVPLYDLILTTKSYNVRQYQGIGATRAEYIANSYDPRIHHPAAPTPAERERMAGDVAFIGTFRPNRADFLARIAAHREFRMNIWGTAWEKMRRFDHLHRRRRWRPLEGAVHYHEVWCGDMGKAFQCNAIALGLLYRESRDLQTCRSFEIPACGGFMLAERTEEHRLYFTEDREAVYFDSFDELMAKLRFYAAHESIRRRIARAGYERCIQSPYSIMDRARFALAQLDAELHAASGPRLAVSGD